MNTIINGEMLEIWHKDYNVHQSDNLSQLPAEKAVFGVFAIINENPVNCRFIGETDNLRESVTALFEKTEISRPGLRKFMQGPWIKLLQFRLMPGSTEIQRNEKVQEWSREYNPGVDEEGEYPGYYD